MTIFFVVLLAMGLFLLVRVLNHARNKERAGEEQSLPTGDTQHDGREFVEEMTMSVTTVDYDKQVETITKVIEGFIQEGMLFDQSYMGLTDKAIRKSGIRTYELAGVGLPAVYIEEEESSSLDGTAIKVIIRDVCGDSHHIGYVPARLRSNVKAYMRQYHMEVDSSIIGGTYKDVIIDDEGVEAVQTFASDYGLKIHLFFWEHEPSQKNISYKQ